MRDGWYDIMITFGIKKTKNDFSRLPIDLTLEQTINADTASQKNGISYFMNSISARQRWADSHFDRMEVLSEVLNKLDMTTKEDVSQDLNSNRITENTRDLEKNTKKRSRKHERFQ